MSYLKALAVLRLVSEDKKHGDAAARGSWENGMFVLRSRLDQGELVTFFLESYRPTPIVAPWGARSGFFSSSSERTAREALKEIKQSTHPRFGPFRQTIATVHELLSKLGLTEKAQDDDKLQLLYASRANLPDELLEWLDTCYVLSGDGRKYPPLLGTGGNEGSGSYVSGFAQQVLACVLHREHDDALQTALFGTLNSGVSTNQTPGHFSPSAAGGANAGQGMEGPLQTNPWDYVLCLEGACLWASGVVRRFGQSGPSVAAFPFTVNVTSGGGTSLATNDNVKPKQAKRPIAEMWLPVWSRPVTVEELKAIFSEGRVSVGRRIASNGVDFVRGISELGVDRGISAFARVTFLMRNGQSFLAVPQGLVEVCERKFVDLLHEIDGWIEAFRRACRTKEEGAKSDPPPRYRTALRAIDAAIFDYCRYSHGENDPTWFQLVLAALGAAERELAVGGVQADKRRVRWPLAKLSSEWIGACNDGSSEFLLACSLAFMKGEQDKTGRIRRYLEPVEFEKGGWRWSERGGHVVWSGVNLAQNLGAVLARRLMDAEAAGETPLPFDSDFRAPINSVAAFLARDIDEEKLGDLLWGLMLVESRGRLKAKPVADRTPLPSAYPLLKLTLMPQKLKWDAWDGNAIRLRFARTSEEGISVKPEPAILANLRAGQIQRACEIAARRLRASGLIPLASHLSDGSQRALDWSVADVEPARLLAALLFPIRNGDVNTLANLVLRTPIAESLT
jgi:CRISPR-associated protein Csx17